MASRILFISSGEQLATSVNFMAASLNMEVDTYEYGYFHDHSPQLDIPHENYDVIIAQYTMSEDIRIQCKKPTIGLRVSAMDYLNALIAAKKFGQPVALICPDPMVPEVHELRAHVSGLDFITFTISGKKAFFEHLPQLLSLKGYTFVGVGYSIQYIAAECKSNFVRIETRPSAILEALLTAKQMIQMTQDAELQNSRFKSIINNIEDGVVSIDSHGIITSCNTTIEKILLTSQEKILHKKIKNLSSNNVLSLIYGDGKNTKNQSIYIKNSPLIINRIPIMLNDVVEEIIITLRKPTDTHTLKKFTDKTLAKGLVASKTFADIIGKSTQIKNLITRAQQYCQSSASVLIEGETGTGKEVLAQAMHNSSPRCNKPFVAINCATLSEELLESELFGHEEGAFTGARRGGKAGLFEVADKGTIFLDEIGEISPSIQARLLRVLQEQQIMRLGGDKVLSIDTRIIAATNKNIYQLVRNGKFREDLYYRINLLHLNIPPLRERIEDIPALSTYFLSILNMRYDKKDIKLLQRHFKLLQQWAWPGNIRELQNFIEKIHILHNNNTEEIIHEIFIEHTEIKEKILKDDSSNISIPLGSMKSMNDSIIQTLMKKYNGDKKIVASILDISRVTLWKKEKTLATL